MEGRSRHLQEDQSAMDDNGVVQQPVGQQTQQSAEQSQRQLLHPTTTTRWENYPVSGDPPPNAILMRNVDTVFILSYSIIMLNTDLHNKQVKHKMKPEV